MFTGIIEELGLVAGLDGRRVTIACRTVREDSAVGASVAMEQAFAMSPIPMHVVDGTAYVCAVVTLAAVALVAMLGPARRAARVDPVVALRTE